MRVTIYDPVTGGESGSITVRDGFHAIHGSAVLDRVRFTDTPGTVWNRIDLELLTLAGSNAGETITGFSTDDVIRGNGGNDRLDGVDGNDDIAGGVGNDVMKGGNGDDVFRFGHGQGVDELSDTSGVNKILLDAGIVQADVALYRTSSIGPLNDQGYLPAKTSDGLVLVLNGSGEQLWVRNFFNGSSPRPISQIVFDDGTIWDAAAIDANTVNQGGTQNTVAGTSGNDQFTVDHSSDGITEAAGAGTDGVTSSVTYTLPTNVENITLTGVLNINATGNVLSNTIQGNSGNNTLYGGFQFNGVNGLDTMTGGAGDDTYIVDMSTTSKYFDDIVIEASNAGYDRLIAQSHSAILPDNVEVFVIDDVSYSTVFPSSTQVYTANALDNFIDASEARTGGYGFTIDGGAGADVMIGPTNVSYSGNVDRILRYIVDNVGDVVIGSESVYDLVQTSLAYILPTAVEHLDLTGSANVSGTGNASHNNLNGSTSSGANVLAGGLGNDRYTLGAGDTAIENAGEGSDTLVLTVASPTNVYDLAQFANIENLELTSAAGAMSLVGDAAANVLVGNSSANTLTGGAGNDQLTGGSGVDRYYGFGAGSGVDVITDTSGVVDTVEFASGQSVQVEELQFSRVVNDLRIGINAQDSVTVAAWFAGSANAIEELELWENGLKYRYNKTQLDARIAGTNSAPVSAFLIAAPEPAMATQAFSFEVPANTFSDIESQHALTYSATLLDGSPLPTWLTFDSQTRTLSGTPSSGDIGFLSIRITATDPSSLSASSSFSMSVTPFVLIGTAGNDVLTGDENDNEIYGLAGDDTIQGLGGHDYLAGDEDHDTLSGGAGDDSLSGGAGNDLLDGGTGADSLSGDAGDDVYVVDSIDDSVWEFAAEGTDTIQSGITYTVPTDFENLTLTGSSAINGTGNSLANTILGNGASNTLSGGSVNDTLYGGGSNDSMSGGQGNDTFYVDHAMDTTGESSGQGTDTVYASLNWTLATNVEHLVLTGTGNITGTGNGSSNTITGNSGNNALSGGTGTDTMLGGAGNDTYTVDNTGDVVTEGVSEGVDLVSSSVAYTIGNNVENLTLTSTAASGTGNGLDNVLIGNGSNNTLTGHGGNDAIDGGGGNDTMVGGQGNDTYTVAQTMDVVTEAANEGTDLVNSSVTYTIGNNVENLTLTSTAASGTGNGLDNVLTGNGSNNTLTGNDGNDTLNGLGGTDTMVGGNGNDVYFIDIGADVTTENANQGIDTINSSITKTLASNIEALFLTGSSAINATGLTTANLLRGNTGTNTLNGAGGTDILEGLAGTDTLQNSVSANTFMNGGADNDTLTGTASKDFLIGGTGNDAITTGQGADVIVFNQGEGQDTVAASTTKDNTLALGGGILYADLLFQKTGNNLILKTGGTDQITFTNYYASASNRSVDKLQIVIEDTTDYASGSGDATRNKKIATFDFDGLVTAFDAALVANPGLTTWALTNALVAQHLGGSDTAAIGGDLAYRYGRVDSLSDISFTPALALLAAAGFGSSAQNLQALASLQDASPRLS
jgi:trimeric autotransporter adhesin